MNSADDEMREYCKRDDQEVTAVQMRLELEEFTYNKWGATQHGKPSDWVVDNQGEVYTIDQETFAATYKPVSPGRYVKVAHVWAEQATKAGVIDTKEGETHYHAGDWVVYNNADLTDGYAISAERFDTLYVPIDTSGE